MIKDLNTFYKGAYTIEDIQLCKTLGAYIVLEGDGFRIVKDSEPTPEELYEELAKEIRSKRDKLLRDTDKYLISDYPISPESLEQVKAYRVSLRELPEQSGFPTEVVFPVMPKIVDPTKSQESQVEDPKQDVGLAKVGM